MSATLRVSHFRKILFTLQLLLLSVGMTFSEARSPSTSLTPTQKRQLTLLNQKTNQIVIESSTTKDTKKKAIENWSDEFTRITGYRPIGAEELKVELQTYDPALSQFIDSTLLATVVKRSGNLPKLAEETIVSNANRYRLIRLLNSTKKQLQGKSLSELQVTHAIETLSENVLKATQGIDSIHQNALWQEKVNSVFQTSGPEIKSIFSTIKPEIQETSWFGIHEYSDLQPAYFNKSNGSTEKAILKKSASLDFTQEHTYNIRNYAENRLENTIKNQIHQSGKAPEIFLGTPAELERFYGTQGYSTKNLTITSNNNHFHLLSGPKGTIVVIQGVDSESRLYHIGALLKHEGIDPSKLKVRGE